jgi:hypothetical protein
MRAPVLPELAKKVMSIGCRLVRHLDEQPCSQPPDWRSR